MPVTIKDVAKLAGVSITTVSRALNHHSYVSESTQKKIRNAMEELNYSPNQLARNFFRAQTCTIGMVVPTIAHPFFSEITQLVEQSLYDNGYHILLCTTEGNRQRESDIFDMLRQHRMDAIIIGSPSLPEKEYSRVGIPIVAFDTLLRSANVSIASNHRLGGQLAAEVLLKSGCKNFVQIVGNPEAKTGATERHQVFLQEVMAAGYPCVSLPIRERFYDTELYPSIVEKILDTYPDADGFFATDLFAAEILKCTLRRHYTIPDNFQLVGYDGTYVSKFTHPQITTIRQPIEDLAATIVDSLIRLIQEEPVEPYIILDQLRLVGGGTTRYPFSQNEKE